MHGFTKELKEAVNAFVALKHSFSIDDVKTVIDEITKQSGAYKDQITTDKIRKALFVMLEKGDIPGYCLSPKPIVDEDGPKYILEFALYNPMAISKLEMLELPQVYERVNCRIHPYYKRILRALSKTTNASQDMIARSILTRGLSLVFDQLK